MCWFNPSHPFLRRGICWVRTNVTGFADRGLTTRPRYLMHIRKDSNLYQRFWRPSCYHCTTHVSEEEVRLELTKLLHHGSFQDCCLTIRLLFQCGSSKNRTCSLGIYSPGRYLSYLYPLCGTTRNRTSATRSSVWRSTC